MSRILDRQGNDVTAIYIVFLSFGLVVIFFLLKGDIGLDLSDEGHLWYGVRETAEGAVPIRDFRAYDPGRYYWAAGWYQLLGPGILNLRIANMLFQIVGLTLGLLAVSRVIRNKWLLVMVGVLLLVWMFPRHKVYESSLALSAVFFVILLLEKPSFKRHFIAGIFVGTAAFFGRNLGVYSFVSILALILYGWFRLDKQALGKRLAVWSAGIAVGYSPMLLMVLFIPGFLASFVDSILLMFGPGAPVLPLPFPWPWALRAESWISIDGLQALVFSLTLLIVPVFYLWAAFKMLVSKRDEITPGERLLTASVVVGIPMLHHILVRADVAHLGQSIHPFLIGITAVPFAFKLSNRWLLFSLAGFILILTTMIALPRELFPVVRKYEALVLDGTGFVRYEVAGDSVWVTSAEASYIGIIREFFRENVGAGENIFIAPYEPGFYPILGKPSPTWDPYPLFPVEAEEQEEIIDVFGREDVNWAYISNRAVDGMEARRFSKTHSVVWQYLMDEFELVDLPGLPEDRLILHRQP